MSDNLGNVVMDRVKLSYPGIYFYTSGTKYVQANWAKSVYSNVIYAKFNSNF